MGAVALDSVGDLAAGTSTGGITAKKAGRVGDSPIIGSGGYADNELGAASTTGHGESLMRCVLSYHTVQLLQGMQPGAATEAALQRMAERVQGHGGVILVDRHGCIGMMHTTERMAWAAAKGGEVRSGIDLKAPLQW